jgi:hypothetical protein
MRVIGCFSFEYAVQPSAVSNIQAVGTNDVAAVIAPGWAKKNGERGKE